jgi:hypothetical protein
MTPDGKERYEHTEVGTDPVKLGNRVSVKMFVRPLHNLQLHYCELFEVTREVQYRYYGTQCQEQRTFLASMDGSCQVPIGGYANYNNNNEIEFTGLIMTPTSLL